VGLTLFDFRDSLAQPTSSPAQFDGIRDYNYLTARCSRKVAAGWVGLVGPYSSGDVTDSYLDRPLQKNRKMCPMVIFTRHTPAEGLLNLRQCFSIVDAHLGSLMKHLLNCMNEQ
jgi:hypothetical protein